MILLLTHFKCKPLFSYKEAKLYSEGYFITSITLFLALNIRDYAFIIKVFLLVKLSALLLFIYMLFTVALIQFFSLSSRDSYRFYQIFYVFNND